MYRTVLAAIVCVGLILAAAAATAADFTTPGTGSTYSLANIVTMSSNATVDGGPTAFTLKGNLTVAQPDTLAIAAGESLIAEADASGIGYALIIRGKIQAVGASGNLARLAAQVDQPGQWRGIIIMHASPGPNTINWCRIEDARSGVSVFTSGATEIANSIFENLYGAAIFAGPGAVPSIHDNTITPGALGTGLALEGAGATLSVMTNAQTGGAAGFRSAGAAPGAMIQGNTLTNVDYGLISDGDDAATFSGNTVTGGIIGAVAGNAAVSQWTGNTISGQSMAGMGSVNESTAKIRSNSFSNSGSLGSLFIDDNSQPDMGTGAEAGLNTFAPGAQWDLVNFSPLFQNAVGNTWSSMPPDVNVYDYYDDTPDVDGNSVTSGRVFYEVSSVTEWMML